ncbi:MAG: hypothetical protein WC725_04820 [Patescibacteria group bacterium]|jgi:hypothetical protein
MQTIEQSLERNRQFLLRKCGKTKISSAIKNLRKALDNNSDFSKQLTIAKLEMETILIAIKSCEKELEQLNLRIQ